MTNEAATRTLLVATAGGHLQELVKLAPHITGVDHDAVWVTNENAQSRSLLAGNRVEFVPFIDERDIAGVRRAIGDARRLHSQYHFDRAISTGSAIALSYLPYLRLRGVSTHYIESITRVTALSRTGRILRRTPGVHVYLQHPNRGLPFIGSALDSYATSRAEKAVDIKKVVVTLGTMKMGFRRLLSRLCEILPRGAQVLWQTGHTDVAGLDLTPTPWLPASDPRQRNARGRCSDRACRRRQHPRCARRRPNARPRSSRSELWRSPRRAPIGAGRYSSRSLPRRRLRTAELNDEASILRGLSASDSKSARPYHPTPRLASSPKECPDVTECGRISSPSDILNIPGSAHALPRSP